MRVSRVEGGESSKGKESRKGVDKVKDNPVSAGDQKQPMLLWDFLEEGVTEADQEEEDQKGEK